VERSGSAAHEAFAHILFEVSERVARITLNDPNRLNPISHGPDSMEADIIDALTLADADPDVRCVVITGAGRAFSSGGDDRGLPPMERVTDHLAFLASADRANERVRLMNKPTIGAINGLCYGAALMLALHFDLLVASEDARFGMIETRFGQSGVEMLPFWVGAHWAKFLALTGELITAEKAKEIGLVIEVLPSSDFSRRVDDLARRVAAMPPDAVMLNRRLINGAMTLMGWTAQKQLALALNTLTNATGADATSADGRNFQQVMREQGWQAFKDARDAPFRPPWLE
jgi:enoyl-CoA hydratase/carnithine racemase